VRRRRFLFDPPSGWQGFSLDGFDTHYLAPGHPRAPGCLSVYAARPATSSLAEWWRVNGPLTGAGATFSSVPVLDEPLIGPDHLGGRRVQLRGNDGQRAMAAELTCLADRDYWYPIVLVCDAASLPERSAAVASVIRSIRPLTRPAPTSAQVAAVHHWFQ
jgi:hypothetical protein